MTSQFPKAILALAVAVASVSAVALLARPGENRVVEPRPVMLASTDTAPAFAVDDIRAARSAIAAERMVRDFILDPNAPVSLQIAVLNDGTSRTGLAAYFCLRLRELGVYNSQSAVRIVDAGRLAQANGDFQSISLGAMRCETEQPFV